MSILIAPAVLIGIALALGAGLIRARSRLPGNDDILIDAVEALLPQTQCAQCGYLGCRPYAEAVAKGAALDLCPPEGRETVAALRSLLSEDASQSTAKPQRTAAGLPATGRIMWTVCAALLPRFAVLSHYYGAGYLWNLALA